MNYIQCLLNNENKIKDFQENRRKNRTIINNELKQYQISIFMSLLNYFKIQISIFAGRLIKI